jgi:plastocyanin
MLVLAVTVAAPALSAAQDDAAPVTPPAPPTPVPPAPPATPDPPAETAQQVQVQSQAAPAPAAMDRSAVTEKPKAKPAASKTVSIGDNFFSPATVTIDAGDTVTWKNNGASAHTATANNGSFDTGQIPAGQSRSETFSTAGDVPYFCTLHAGQTGTVKVLAASGSGGSGGGGGTAATTGSSEAAAVASTGAAGSSTSLPATGFVAIALFAIGFGLVGSGSYLKRLEQRITSSAS